MSVVTRGRVLIPAVLALSATLLATTAAFAVSPNPGDIRAKAFEGNARTCADAGLDGYTIKSPGTEDSTKKFVTITDDDLPAGATLLAVVVKGGHAYNVYHGLSTWTNLQSPINRGGQIPVISHWFACVDKSSTTKTTDTTTTDTTTTTTTTTGSGGGTTSGTSTMTNTPGGSTTTSSAVGAAAAGNNQTPGTGELAFTGFANGWLVWVAALLLIAGGIAVALPKLARRR